jgi:hypothetical protein
MNEHSTSSNEAVTYRVSPCICTNVTANFGAAAWWITEAKALKITLYGNTTPN